MMLNKILFSSAQKEGKKKKKKNLCSLFLILAVLDLLTLIIELITESKEIGEKAIHRL